MSWRSWLSLAFVFVFIVVSFGHAGKHLTVAADYSSIAYSASTDFDGASDTAAADEICTFCALVAAQVETATLAQPSSASIRVAFVTQTLDRLHRPAESPPPIV